MSTYTIGSTSYTLDFEHSRVLKQLVAQVVNKLDLTKMESQIRCSQEIAHDWLSEVLEEVERWYLDDYDPEAEQMTIPKEDIGQFEELRELVTSIVTQNNRKKEKFVTTSQARVLATDWSEFLREFAPQEQVIHDFHRRGTGLPKNILYELVTRVQDGIENGKKIRWRD
ncbi:MAG: hypothetical protein ACW99J_17835 [Candidatus Thorarchaeota archaeon]|jgi:hypothetical protein